MFGQTLEMIIQRGIDATGAEAGSIWRLEERRRIVSPVAALGPNAAGLAGLRLQAGEGIVGRVIRDNEEILLEDVIQNPAWALYFDNFSGFNTRSVLCVPLLRLGTPVGALQLLNKRDGCFTDDDLELARHLAGEAVALLEAGSLIDEPDSPSGG